eukprot:gene67409-92339_t
MGLPPHSRESGARDGGPRGFCVSEQGASAVFAEVVQGAVGHGEPGMSIADRMKLADGKTVKRRMFAAMAQQDCGQCGYLCETYSAAIAAGTEPKLNLCAPG